MATLEALHRHIQALQADLNALHTEKAVAALLIRYAHVVDYGEVEAYTSLFTADGAFELQSGARNRHDPDEPFPYPEDNLLERGGRRTAKGFRYEGHGQLLHFIGGVNPKRLRLHAVLQPQIRVEGDQAWSESQMVAFGKELGSPRQLLVFGRYFDHIVREADGVWRFKERICEV